MRWCASSYFQLRNDVNLGISNWLELTKKFLFHFWTFHNFSDRGSVLRNQALPLLPLGILSLVCPYLCQVYSSCYQIVFSSLFNSINDNFSYKNFRKGKNLGFLFRLNYCNRNNISIISIMIEMICNRNVLFRSFRLHFISITITF